MDRSIIRKITTAVADARGVDPTELEFVLADYVDCDALYQLEGNGASTWTLSFELPDHTVTVHSDESVLVDGR